MRRIKKRTILIYAFTMILTAALSSGITYFFTKERKTMTDYEQTIIESPYTLEELYALTENPSKYMEMINNHSTNLAYTLIHFYDYFDKSTPVKIIELESLATENKKIEYTLTGTHYVDYYEYSKRLGNVFDRENEARKTCQENGIKEEDCFFNYRTYASLAVLDITYKHYSEEQTE